MLPSFRIQVDFSDRLSSPMVAPSSAVAVVSPIIEFAISIRGFVPFEVPTKDSNVSQAIALPFFFAGIANTPTFLGIILPI